MESIELQEGEYILIIATEKYAKMERDIANLMGMDEMSLFLELNEVGNECLDRENFDWDKYDELINDFVEKQVDFDDLDEIYIYHLGRHIKYPNELWTLNEVLLTETSLSQFLKEYDIEFGAKKGKIQFFYKNKLITPEQILVSGHFHLLAKRLGYLGEPDFCVNGFAFWSNAEKTMDGYYHDLQRGPEILENLERFLGINLLREYEKQSKYYGIVFRKPIDKVIFDGKDDVVTHEQKVKCFLNYALKYLHDFYRNCEGGNNLMIRIKDTEKAVVDHCILIDEENIYEKEE